MDYEIKERCKIVVWMDQFNSPEIVQRKYFNYFASEAPSIEFIKDLYEKFFNTGCVVNSDNSYKCENCKNDPIDSDWENTEDITADSDMHIENGETETLITNIKTENKEFAEINIQANDVPEPKEPFLCPQCFFKVDSKELFDEHMVTHLSEFFKCRKCAFATNSTSVYRGHVKDCTGYRKSSIQLGKLKKFNPSSAECFTCEICEKSYSSIQSLKMHEVYHSTTRPYPCTKCNYRFNTEKGLKRHLVTHDHIRRLECQYCSYTCNLSGNMKVHLRTHSGEKPFKCLICDYASKSSTLLKRHELIHSEVQKFSCDQCPYVTHRKTLLQTHSLVHSTELLYNCHICGEKFRTPQIRKYHVRRQHENLERLECPFCDYTQTEMPALKSHIRTHTGERPYKCEICGKAFLRSQELKRHMKTKHCDATVDLF